MTASLEACGADGLPAADGRRAAAGLPAADGRREVAVGAAVKPSPEVAVGAAETVGVAHDSRRDLHCDPLRLVRRTSGLPDTTHSCVRA